MDRNKANELLPIIQAYAEGKTIQSRCIKGDTSLWYDDEDPSFDDDFEYRIKPEPKYRPFANAEECWAEMQKHQPFGWVKDRTANEYVLITTVENDGDITIYNKIGWKFNNIILRFTFADGIPFGVKVEEN